MVKKCLRVAVGVLLICTVIPPLSIGFLNNYVLILPLVGAFLIVLPIILRVLKAMLGKYYGGVIKAACVLLITAAAVFAVEFCFIFANSFPQKAPADSVVIVPGAGVAGDIPSPILLGRIDAAAAYLKEHPSAACIATGGRGKGEDVSEGALIKEWLTGHYGISPGRVYADEKSTDTAQNMDNAVKIIDANGLSKNVVIATDGFHLFRAKLLASRRGLKPYSLPAKTKKGLAVELYVRELIGLPKSIIFNR